MAKKTNKTAHLLNTLTSGTAESEETRETQESPAKETGEAHAVPENKVIVVNETSENEKLSNEIKGRLEAQLEAEVADAAASGEVTAASVDLSKESVGEEVPTAAPASEKTPVAENETPAAEITEEKQQEDPREREYHMMNVMEKMLSNMEEEMESEMRQNGVCMCDRCRADVQALVLTQMPAKYVIVDSSNISPIMGYYESHYKISMLTEILKACVKVKEKPRH